MTYTTTLSFPNKTEAFAYLDLFGYTAIPVRNRYTNRSVGDFGEARVGFAHIEEMGGYVNGSEVYTVSAYMVHETDTQM